MDWYLDELVGELKQQTEKLVSIPTLWQSLVYCGISGKKVSANLFVVFFFCYFYCNLFLLFLYSYIKQPMNGMNFLEAYLLQKLNMIISLNSLYL